MQMPSSLFPDLEALTAGIISVVCDERATGCQATVLKREPALYASTSPCEIVTCRLDDGTQLRLFCKYGRKRRHAHSFRRGVAYEAKVYRQVLKPLRISKDTFYGACKDMTTGNTWLTLKYLDGYLRMNKAHQPASMCQAARWLGRFHAANQTLISSTSMAFLTMYDADHYLGWASRTLMISGFLYQDFPWLETLCKHWEKVVGELLLPPETIIHGEFYPQNVLINDGTVCPVDWESSAIAVGEIDLAALTENWPEEIVKQCKLEYQRERWGKSTHVNFQQRFDAARIYLQLRWLGEQKGLTPHEYKNNLWRFEKLRSIGERLGLI